MGGIVDAIGDAVGGAMDFVGDVVGGAVDAVGDVIGGIGDMVEDVIPGGWATVGAGALLAMGIYNPALLGLAEEGALTAEALTGAGLDAAAVAEGVAAVPAEVAAASAEAAANGVAPELIAAANTTADPLAALADLGATDASLGAAGAANAANTLPPVVDAVGTVVNANLPEATIASGMKSLGSAGLESLGLGNMSATQIAGLMAAGALAPSVLNALGYTGGAGSKGTNYAPIAIPKVETPTVGLAKGGLGAGWITAQPMYHSTDPTQAQFYWGEHPYMAKPEDLANYNNIPNAPETPWSVRSGSQPFDVNAFIRNTINPQWQAASAGAAPELYRAQPTQTSVTAIPIATPVNTPAVEPAVVTAPVAPDLVTPLPPSETTQSWTVPVDQTAAVVPDTTYQPAGYPVGAAKVMSGTPLYAADIINAALTPVPLVTH